ncbi:MAG: helix-turn-helix domain-containing protein [Erythrobacter sp.]|nr:helix-turn-helix domain-containing protein [Erythrobacter sp.]
MPEIALALRVRRSILLKVSESRLRERILAYSSHNELETTVAKYLAHWRKAEISEIVAMCATDVSYHDLSSGAIISHEELEQFLKDTFTSETGSKLDFNSITYPNSNSAFIHWTQHLKVPGQRKAISVGGVELIVIENGKIISVHEFYDYRVPAPAERDPYKEKVHDEQMRKLGLCEADVINIQDRLERYFSDNQAFLNANINLSRVAQAVNVTRNQLSFVINHGLQSSFYELVNRHRILYVIDQMPPSNVSYSVVSAALEAGFNSISGFYNAFKKQTGVTPSVYRKQLYANNE